MNLIDKFLLALLVVLLPVGLIFSYKMFNKSSPETSVEQVLDTSKLEKVIKDTVAQNQPKVDKPKPFAIASVIYASESASLQVKGVAPELNSSIYVSSVVLPIVPTPSPLLATATPVPSPSPTVIKGTQVEVVSIQPQAGGSFEYNYDLPKKIKVGIIEFRFEQGQTSTTMRFDLDKKKQVL